MGDCHLENFGAYRAGALTARKSPRGRAPESVVFDLNDFDDSFVGPWRIDVLRLLTSLILGGRETGAGGPLTLELCDAPARRVRRRPRSRRKRTVTPCPRGDGARRQGAGALAEGAARRAAPRSSAARGGSCAGRATRPCPTSCARRPSGRSPSTRESCPRACARRPTRSSVVDAAFRVAGTGSLGCLRVAVLVRGKGGPDGAWIFDMKEEGIPSSACLVRPPKLEPAERVVTALRSTLVQPPRMIGTTTLRGASMFVRRLAPQEDKLDLTRLSLTDLPPLARHLGGLLGAAHRRGARRAPKKAWSEKDRARLLAHAVGLAGVHEAMYLAYCDLVR